MVIEKLNEKYIEEAVKLAQADYDMERKYVQALYDNDFKNELTQCLIDAFKCKYGALALENGKLKGFMGFLGPWDGHFGNVKGVFSPLFANAFSGENRGKTASRLFQHTSEEMVADGILSFAICTYSHNFDVTTSLTMNGFGVMCSDAIRKVDIPLNVEINTDYFYEEIHYSEAGCLLKLKNSLVRHMRKSPAYLPCSELTEDEFKKLCNMNKSRFFIVKDRLEVLGYVEVTNDGETFISEAPDMLNICGAYLDENYRGKNLFQSLLAFTLDKIKNNGVKYLGVDCETINPNAMRFWGKYFDSYTYSFHRRIDERIII